MFKVIRFETASTAASQTHGIKLGLNEISVVT